MSRTLILMDGSNFAFRSFFATPMMTSSRGLPTNALVGFTNILLKTLRRADKPEHLAVVFDTATPTFRKERFEAYKAQRKELPPELGQQFPYFKSICEALAVPYLALPGYEADDIIATIAHRLKGQDIRIEIHSTDKDLMQLVDTQVFLNDTLKGVVYDEAGVVAKWGVPPNRLRDLLALMGDSSDNVPGVPGIGPKKAKDLLAEFDTVENLLARVDEVRNPRIRDALKQHEDKARLSLELVTLLYDVPMDTSLPVLTPTRPDPTLALSLFRELEFRTQIREFEAALAAQQAAAVVADTPLASSGAPHEGISSPPAGDGALQAKAAASLYSGAETASDAPASSAGSAPRAGGALHVRIVRDAPALMACAKALSAASGLAFQTLRQAGGEVLSIALAPTSDEAFVIPLGLDLPGWKVGIRHVLSVLQVPGIQKVGHDLKGQARALALHGIEGATQGDDTWLMAQILDLGRAEALLSEQLQVTLGMTVPGGSSPIPPLLMLEDAAQVRLGHEAAGLWPLVEALKQNLQEKGLLDLYESVERPLLPVLASMERRGVGVDVSMLGALSVEFEGRIAQAEARCVELAGETFNPGSPKQLQVILFEKLKLPVVKRTKTGPSTDSEVLEELSEHHGLPAEILNYRSLVKLKGTYIDALPRLVNAETGRVHTTFHQAGTATGRLSSVDPNLQNIPVRGEEGKRIREAFVAPPGMVLLSADYSQIELRLLAHFCEDETLIQAFRDGLDIHAATAAEMHEVDIRLVTSEMRRSAKAINFGILYGMGAFRLSRELKISRKDAERFIARYFGRYPRVKAFLDETLSQARGRGYVTTLYQRRRMLPDLTAGNAVLRQAAERMAINTPIQGSAADLIKKAMIRLEARLLQEGLRTRMVLQVHDELIFEVPEDEVTRVTPLIRAELEGVEALKVPLTVDVGTGRSWALAH